MVVRGRAHAIVGRLAGLMCGGSFRFKLDKDIVALSLTVDAHHELDIPLAILTISLVAHVVLSLITDLLASLIKPTVKLGAIGSAKGSGPTKSSTTKKVLSLPPFLTSVHISIRLFSPRWLIS